MRACWSECVDGSGFRVDLNALFGASVAFQDHRLWANQILGRLSGELAGTSGMAGADPAGVDFGRKYDAAARATAEGLSVTGASLGQIGLGLLNMVENYIRADAASNVFNPNVPLARAAAQECEAVRVSIASAVGENAVNVIAVLVPFWPQGDPVRLRRAAAAWEDAAIAIGHLTGAADASARAAISSGQGSGLDMFASYWGRFHGGASYNRPLLDLLQQSCRQLSQACIGQAGRIENLQHTLEGLAAAAGLIAVGALVLTPFTVGLSDVGGTALEAGVVADAGVAVAAFEAAELGAVELTVLASTAVELEEVAAALPAVELAVAGVTAVSVDLVAILPAAAATFGNLTMDVAAAPMPPTVGPLPPLPTPGFGLLSPADQAKALAWQLSLPSRPIFGSSPGDPEYDYQLRVAGPTEYQMQGGSARPIYADGFRPQDGAIVDAKYVKDPQLTCYTVDNSNQRPPFVYQNIMSQEQSQLDRYGAVLNDPKNQAHFMEIDTNSPVAAAYFQVMLDMNGIHGRSRYAP